MVDIVGINSTTIPLSPKSPLINEHVTYPNIELIDKATKNIITDLYINSIM